MKEVISGPVEPYVPEVPPFDLTDPDAITETKKKVTYTLALKVKKTASNFHKVIHLTPNTDLDLTLRLVK